MSDSQYSKLEEGSENGDQEALLSNHNPALSKSSSKISRISQHIITLVLVCIAFGMGTLVQSLPYFNKDSLCAAHTVQYTPPIISTGPKIEYSTVSFNGSFMQADVYRQDAGPVVDKAWEDLGVNYRAVTVPESEAKAAGLTDDHIRINARYGGGLPANVEGLHHLHCLNLLRQTSKYNFDYYKTLGEGAFKNDDMIVKLHVTHCLDIIRQRLMCTPDLGVFGQVWTQPESPKAFVDFNTDHKCVNYDAIREWAKERQLPADVPADFLEPPRPGQHIFASTP